MEVPTSPVGTGGAKKPSLGFAIAHPGDFRSLSNRHPDASKLQLSPHQVLPTPLALPVQVSSSPSTPLTQMPPSPNLASALLTPDASKPQLSFDITHPGAFKTP